MKSRICVRRALGLKEVVAELLMENRCSKKRTGGWEGRYMRYTASEKREIIEWVEQSSLSR